MYPPFINPCGILRHSDILTSECLAKQRNETPSQKIARRNCSVIPYPRRNTSPVIPEAIE